MKRKSRIAISCFINAIVLGILVTSVAYVTSKSTMAANDVYLKAVADVSELGDPVSMPDVRNTTFNVAVYVENVTNLYGFDIQFNWTTQWITYTGYTVTQPVEVYPDVQPPSPYAGILHEPTMKLKEAVDESANIPLAEPGTMAWIAYSSMSPAPTFNGSGTICVFTFNVTDQPFDYQGSVTIKIHFIKTDLSASPPGPIPHIVQDLDITLHPRKLEYPPVPMLKVTPEFVTDYGINETFSVDVLLLGADGGDLDPFWDVAGCDFYLNFNSTMLQALNITIDPDGDFGDFWESGTFELCKDIDNTEGWVHIAFIGIGATHSPVNGTIRIATVDFNVTYESELRPEGPLDLENPLVPLTWYILDAEGGIIDLSMPETTNWLTIFPVSRYGLGFNITDWEDVDGDGKLSEGDQLILLNKDTLKTHDYYLNRITGTLELKEKAFNTSDTLLVADLPCHNYAPWPNVVGGMTSDDVWNGTGNPYWTGNITVGTNAMSYPAQKVWYIEVHPQIGAPYNLTEGVDFVVHPDGKIELLTPLDEQVLNEFVGTMPDIDLGWPALNYTASSIQSVWIEMPNGTKRYASNSGYHSDKDPAEPMPPGGEWWFDPDFPYEIESWWASGYAPGPWTWPNGTDIYVNYTAPVFIDIHYLTLPDPTPKYVEWTGSYDEFLALGDPTNTSWHEVYPTYSNTWNITAFDDLDASGNLSPGDYVVLEMDGLSIGYDVITISTDIEVIEKRCVQDLVPGDPYYTDPIIVDIAGYPHPERNFSPWYGRPYGIPLPHTVENSVFQVIPEFNCLPMLLMFLMLSSAILVAAMKISKKK